MKFVNKLILSIFVFAIFSAVFSKRRSHLKNKDVQRTAAVVQNGEHVKNLVGMNISCTAGSALTYFKLVRPEDNKKFQFEFECLSNPAILNKVNKLSTPHNSVGDTNSLPYLDRHEMNCPTGEVLSQYQMKHDEGKKQIWYEYSCTQAHVKNCVKLRTNETEGKNEEVIYLDRQSIKLTNNKVLASLKFNTRWSGSEAYHDYIYTACDLKTPDEISQLNLKTDIDFNALERVDQLGTRKRRKY